MFGYAAKRCVLRPVGVPVVVVILLLAAAVVHAGTAGKISGIVTDAETGQPIAGALVRVAGTDLSARTDATGRYVILNVPVGSHTLMASMLGEEGGLPSEGELMLFQPIEIQELKVSVDLDTEQDIMLSSKPVELGTIVVVAERPLVIKDRTASLRIVEGDQIQGLPTRGYRDLLALQPGVVVRRPNEINVRGGRTSEVAYFVDGFSTQDPLTGISTTQINNNDLQEVAVVTGGFNAEYGWIASGAVNVTTKSGGEKLAATTEAITDNFHGESFDYNIYDATVSGPLLGVTDKVRFLVSSERRWQKDRTPTATFGGPKEHNDLSGWTWHGKLNWKVGPAGEFKLGGLSSRDDWQEWRSAWQFDLEHAPRYEDKNQYLYGTYEHIVNPKTFFSVSGNYFVTEQERGDGVHFDDIWAYGRPGAQSLFDETQLFRSWDDINGPTPTEDTVIDGRRYILRGDEGAIFENYRHRKSSYVGFDFDVNSQIHRHHEVRAGLDYQRHTLRRYNHLWPSRVWAGYGEGKSGFVDVDRYGYNITGESEEDGDENGAKHPVTFAAFLQDKFEAEGLVINAGLRLDYLNVNTQRLRDPENPLDPFHLDRPDATDEERQRAQQLDPEDLVDSKAEVELSPRFGVAFPVSERSVFHTSYGRFVQRPDLQNLYVSYNYLEYMIKEGAYFFPFGNPNLQPERTTAYEAGWTQQLGPNSTFDVTAYYKDVKGLTQVQTQAATPKAFATYRNVDFGTIKGVEFTYDLRRTRNIGFRLSYALSHATGTGSTPNSLANLVWLGGEVPKTPTPLDFDQRHKVVGILDLRAADNEGPIWGSWRPLENTGLSATFVAGSGFPYTPFLVNNAVTLTSQRAELDGGINSVYSGWRLQLDLKATKAFHWAGREVEFQLWVINLLNRKNVQQVFASTGLPNSTGWLETEEGREFRDRYSEPNDSSNLTGEQKYRLRENDPTYYDTPRQIRAGVKISL